MRKIIFASVMAAITAITCSAKSSWPTSTSDDVCLTSSQASKYSASKFPVSKFPTTSYTVNVGSWPAC